ncbi:MAG TPA: ABC transporter ATP-binding protein [Anaerolineales bacterium]|nr:ABC transporter ATP-binding protein [Anaerolineales bacterium]
MATMTSGFYSNPPQPTALKDDTFAGWLVDLRQVVKTYQSSAGTFAALKSIDLHVEAGAFVSIIGKSGSGKSTLINVITGIDRPTSGEVIVDAVHIHTLNEEQIAIWRGRSIGVIFQFFQLLPTLTAVENILLAMDYGGGYSRSERPDRALYLLELVGMADLAHRLPNSLSGGEQQCVAIARALANDPVLLTADEPTGNLDSKSAEMVFHLFENLAQAGKTILMVTHDNELAARAQRTIKLSDGRIVDEFTNR